MCHRMRAELQLEPSRTQPSRQGYCGYCRVLYRNLDQVRRPQLNISSPTIMLVSGEPLSPLSAPGQSKTSGLCEHFLSRLRLTVHFHHWQGQTNPNGALPPRCTAAPPTRLPGQQVLRRNTPVSWRADGWRRGRGRGHE